MNDEAQLMLTPKEWEAVSVRILRIYHGYARPDGRHLECTPDHLTAWRMHQGSVLVKTPRAKFQAGEGDWLFLPNGYRRQDFSEDARLTSLMFRLSWPDGRPMTDIRPGLLVRSEPELDALSSKLDDLLDDQPDAEWFAEGRRSNFENYIEIQSRFESWLTAVFRVWRKLLPNLEVSRTADPRVDAARRWIADQRVVGEVDLRKAADVAGLSVGHLNRLFMEHYQQTTYGFLESLRIQYARRRLLDPDTQIKAVAHELGFNDLARFSAWFRRIEQTSPREYRFKLGWRTKS